MGTYLDHCGRLPVSSDTDRYIIDWWTCAFALAVANGVCSAAWSGLWQAITGAITAAEGTVYWPQGSTAHNGDYVDCYLYNRSTGIEEYIGSYKWACAVCECGAWQNAECVSATQRRRVRTCTPEGCASGEQFIADPTCGAPPSPSVLPLVMLLGAGLVGGILVLR
jgi:hypothetical protein